MREIALDTETTGFDPDSGHRIVEIGCVEMFDRVRTGRIHHVYINPERDMPKEAEAVHGLSSQFLADKPKFIEIADDFLTFIGDAPLVIHNAAFDMKFLNFELRRCGRVMLPMSRAIDTDKLAREKFPGSPASLDALCRRFQIDSSARTFHGALLDSELLAEVYLELTGGRQSVMMLESQASSIVIEATVQPVQVPLRSFPPSEEELLAHQTFVAKLSDPLWNKLAV